MGVAHRVNAGEGGVVIFPGIFGSPIDPSTPLEDRDVAQLGTGLWNRMLIDATRSWKNPRQGSGATSASRPLCARRRRTKRACSGAGRSTGWTISDGLFESGLHAGKCGVETRPDACNGGNDRDRNASGNKTVLIAVAPVSSPMKRRIVFVTSIS